MATKNKIFLSSGIAILVLIIGGIWYYTSEENTTIEIIPSPIENLRKTTNEIKQMECMDTKILNEFSGYDLVKKISDDWKTYDIKVYNTGIDFSELKKIEDNFKEKAVNEKDKINDLEEKIKQNSNLSIEYNLNNIVETYHTEEVIDSYCHLESDNALYEKIKSTKKTIKIATDFLNNILKSDIDITKLNKIINRRDEEDLLQVAQKKYKNGTISLEINGQDPRALNIYYRTNIGDKIYSYETSLSIEKNPNIQIKDLLNGKISFQEYKNTYNEFLTKIDEIFEQ